MTEHDLTLGIDVGTQGARVIVADARGSVVASARQSWPLQTDDSDEREQNPEAWWAAIIAGVRETLTAVDAERVAALSVTATSGTLVLADRALLPVRPAMMWNDKRARQESADAAAALGRPGMRPSFTLAKALWVLRHEPSVWNRVRHLLSAGDWLLARLSGTDPVADYTNALKTGLDLDSLSWPTELSDLGIDHALLPRVVAPASALGTITAGVAELTGLSPRTRVLAGLTDATAAQVAAGAVDEGEWVTTIGTGLSLKGVSAQRIEDASGALYSHRHWSGHWIPSGTSHCGADSLTARFDGDDFFALTDQLPRSISSTLVLPLVTVGEFFPFDAPQARGFELGTAGSRADLFLGYLEGIAFVERLAMERMHAAGAVVRGPQVTMGGGAANDSWMRIRATVLGRSTVRPVETSSAFGAAIIAASAEAGISATARRMVRYVARFDPDPDRSARYGDRYREFLGELSARGYLSETA